MLRLRSAAAAVAMLIPLVASVAGAEPPPAGEPRAESILAEVGRELFVQHCAVCHGSGAKGDGPAAAALQPPPADLTRIAARRGGEFPAPDIAAFIDGRRDLAAHGSRAMPIWGRRFAEDVGSDETGEEMIRGTLAVLVEYLKSIQAK